tara:strand:+ start:607 stop:1071 length:465 start_codon:yes stop_codon:yes gene_type:complete
MYAIAEVSGKQFKVEPGIDLKVPKQSGKVGDKLVFEKVLYLKNDKDNIVGTPFVKDVSVEAKITSHGRDKKIIVFKMKRRKRYRRKHGHRQEFSIITINKIDSKKKTKAAAKTSSKPAAKSTEKKTTTKKATTANKATATKKTTAKATTKKEKD